MNNQSYNNPVIPGFFPDPSIVRVNYDYYIVTSTFQYFPAITISHSKDLVNWEIIGHGITNSEWLDLSSYSDGMGVWAPAISYHNGIFYILFCLVEVSKDRKVNIRGNYVITSNCAQGPYSKPIQLTEEGNDPSLFIENDKYYMVYAQGLPVSEGVKITELNKSCTEAVGEKKILKFDFGGGTYEDFHLEGPHIFKKDNYYYLLAASCNSRYSKTHHSIIGRSENLYGPYEASPYNPFILQNKPDAKISRTGHGNIVQTQNGEWWAPYLCQRKIDGYSILGRETAIDPVEWKEDGWPLLNFGKGPSDSNLLPKLAVYNVKKEVKDDFDLSHLDEKWLFVRNPDENFYSLTQREGYLRIYTTLSDVNQMAARNIILQRQTGHKCVAITAVEFQPKSEGQQAGIINYYDTSAFIKFAVCNENGRKLIVEQNGFKQYKRVCECAIKDNTNIFLQVEIDSHKRIYSYSYDQKAWFTVGEIDDARYLSDEGTSNWGFMGSMIGMFALNKDTNERIPADFDFFTLKNI